MHLDNFEEMRSTLRSKNFKKEKKLSKLERERLLRSFGVTKKDMQAAAKEATIIRKKRKQSIRVALNPTTLNNDKLHEKVEGGIRKMKKSLTKAKQSLRRKESTVDESGNIRRASILVAMIALMDDDESASHRSSLLRRNISNISSSGELGGSSTKGILKHSSSYPSFGEVESDSPMHEVLPTIESKEENAVESSVEDKEEIRRRGKRDKDRSSITKHVDIEAEEDTKKDEKSNNNNESMDEEGVLAEQEADNIEREGMVVSANDGDKDDEQPTNTAENRRTSPSSFATKSTAGDEEEDPTDEGKTTDDKGNTSFSLRDLGCDHAKYLSIKNDIRSASSATKL